MLLAMCSSYCRSAALIATKAERLRRAILDEDLAAITGAKVPTGYAYHGASDARTYSEREVAFAWSSISCMITDIISSGLLAD
jgi:hypothetical protein